jgi:uncharacterized protein
MLKRMPQITGTILAAFFLLSPVTALAEQPLERIISTQGHGETRVKPDSLSLNLMVEATHSELAAARAENNSKMQAIIKALKTLNISNMKMETQNVQVYPMQGEYVKNQLPKTLGYRVTNGLRITVNKADSKMLASFGSRISDAALVLGANHLQGLGFYLEDMTQARREALQAAVKNARENAEAMAEAAGLTINGVHSIEGSPMYSTVMRQDYAATAPAIRMHGGSGGVVNQDLPVEPGEEVISSDITMRFKF